MFEKIFEAIKNYKDNKIDRDAYLMRIHALPKDYQIVYKGIMDYMWSVASNGTGVMQVLFNVLEMFEDGAKNAQKVFDLIDGKDVIGFCDNLLAEVGNKSWMDKMKSDKNESIINAIMRDEK